MGKSSATGELDQAPRRGRQWLWFLAGFLIVFVVILFWPMPYFDGRTVLRTSLWHYYLLEIQRARTATGALGPTSGNTEHAISIAAEHVVVAVVGGLATVGVVRLVRKVSKKT